MGWAACLEREHASTLLSGVEAPRLLKRSLTRLYYSCCFGRGHSTRCLCRQHRSIHFARGALDDHQLLAIGASKKGNSRPRGRSPKNAAFHGEIAASVAAPALKKNKEIVEDFVEKKLQQQRHTMDIVEDFAFEDKNLRNLRRFRICFFVFFFMFVHFLLFIFFSSCFFIFLHLYSL